MARDRRSIRRVPLSNRASEERDEEPDALIYEREEYEAEAVPPRRGPHTALWVAAGVFILLLGAALGLSFRGASITVTPKTVSAEVRHSFTARKDGPLSYSVVTAVKTAEQSVPADAEKKVSEKAHGTIVIFNTYSPKPQRLIKNTRFENPQGLIFRIDRSLVVPGTSVKNGKTVPGSSEATVYADSPGEEYNIPPSDWSIPGFKNDPARFRGFYARSRSAMSGGVEGMVKVPSADTEARARAALRAELEAELRTELAGKVPEGFVLFDGALAIASESLSLASGSGKTALVREKAVGTAYLLKKDELSKAIAGKVLDSYNGLPVVIPELPRLQLTMDERPSGDKEEVRFALSGSATLVWAFDENAFRESLRGKPKAELASVLSAFPTIEKVDVVIRPFWSRSFPDTSDKLTITQVPLARTGTIPPSN